MKIEKYKTYELRLMPNFFEPQKNTLEFFSTTKLDSPARISKYFSYILIDGKLDYMAFGIQIKNYIQKCISGFYGTSEGYFISEDKIDKYYASNDKSLITIDEFYYENHKDEDDLKEYNDIQYYERINFFDIKSRYGLSFKTRDKSGFLEIYNICFCDIDPLWKEGDDKTKITSLYDSVKKLNDYIDDYKTEMIQWGKENNFEYIFGEEGKKYFFDKISNKK